MKILVSACLLGYNVRNNGSNKLNNFILSLKDNHELISVCPEVYGGLSIPRLPIEKSADKVVDVNHDDVTEKIIKGAELSFQKYNYLNCDFAILKSLSPSCGKDLIYDGSFKGVLTSGDGILTTLLKKHHIKVFSEFEIDEIMEYLNNYS